jgi:D-alanyl-D-alanine carboxypeptidase/D-alanyl-D-alanine-endopeptidase (penicillin-binding protein 4)
MRFCSARLACFSLLFSATVCFSQATGPLPAAFPSGATTPLGQQISAIAGEPGVVRAHWGIAVTALDGTPIFGLNEGEFFRPASNAKLFTTAAAMHLLGAGTRLLTRAEATAGADAAGNVQGDLVLKGVGDANLSDRRIPYESAAQRKAREAANGVDMTNPLTPLLELANSISRNVKTIHGDIIGDDTAWPWEPYANDWSIDDAVWGYGAPVSALTINDNQLELTVTPGAKAGEDPTVKLWPGIAYYTLDVKVATVDAKAPASVRIDRDPGSKVLRIRGSVAVGKPYTDEIAIDDPAEYAAVALKSLLEMDDVHVTGVARARHRLSESTVGFNTESHTSLPTLPVAAQVPGRGVAVCLDACPPHAERTSPTLAEDIAVTLKVSQNLHAEMLLRRLGAQYGGDGSFAEGARVVRQFLLNAGLDGDDFIFYDGSGLSGHDLVTPRATAKLLAYATGQPWFAQWRVGLPIGGEDGTLAQRFPKAPLKDHLFAKTGTLSEARALSGYVDCASGKTVIFSVMVDNHAPNTPADRDAMDRIVAAIAASE